MWSRGTSGDGDRCKGSVSSKRPAVAADAAETEAAEMREAIRRSLVDAGGTPAAAAHTAAAAVRPHTEIDGGSGSLAGWAGLLGPAAAAAAARKNGGWRCKHGDPARCYETADKRSPHYGRRFWACDHDRHPKGDWLADPTPANRARCDFWRWDRSFRGFKRPKR